MELPRLEPLWKKNNEQGLSVIAINTYPDTPNSGRIWVDELSLLGTDGINAAPAEPGDESADVSVEVEENSNRRGFSLPCGSGFLLPVFLVVFSLRRNKKTVL